MVIDGESWQAVDSNHIEASRHGHGHDYTLVTPRHLPSYHLIQCRQTLHGLHLALEIVQHVVGKTINDGHTQIR